MLRSLGDGNLFKQGWHSWRDEEAGRSRRRRTFYLDRSHPLVEGVLQSHWNSALGRGVPYFICLSAGAMPA